MYGPSIAVFGFSLAVKVFEIQSIFGQITHFGEIAPFFHIIDNISKTKTARAYPETETEGPYIVPTTVSCDLK